MKLAIDERVKHRLVGFAIVLSIAAIFAPALMKQSSHRFDEKINMVSIKLPPKPNMQSIVIPDKKALFHEVKVAHVTLPSVPTQTPTTSHIVKAEALHARHEARVVLTPIVMKDAVKNPQMPQVAVLKPAVVAERNVLAPKPSVKPPVSAKNTYAVQVATFTDQANAILLMKKLQTKGYKVTMNKIITNKGTSYKILVGITEQKQQAQSLQRKLALAMNLQGFVVPTKVS